jgi:hypothetical protein
MKRIVRLTESDLTRIVRRVINEQTDQDKRYEYIAKLIYNAKGWFMDNNSDVVKGLKLIKDKTQWWKVNAQLQKLTGGQGIAKYIDSFMRGTELDRSSYGVSTVWDECKRIWGDDTDKYPFSEMDNGYFWYQKFHRHDGVN